ncbi:MAG TPA: hypothetical protein VF635_08865 [Propionibacteriaceae bacterium]|jgi:hypothetical protein
MKTSSVRRAATAVALVAGISAGAAGSAQGVVRDVDTVTINGPHADFGFGALVNGHPSSSGTLTWDEATNQPNKPITARLKGTVWWSDTSSGGCAQVRLRVYSTANQPLATAKSAKVCRIGSGAPKSLPVDISVISNVAHKVVITTQIGASAEATFRNEKSEVRYWGQIGGVTD